MSNTPTPTPRTDKSRRYAFQFTPREGVVSAEYASQIERKLTAANEKIAELRQTAANCDEVAAQKNARIAKLEREIQGQQRTINKMTDCAAINGRQADKSHQLCKEKDARIAELEGANSRQQDVISYQTEQLTEARKDGERWNFLEDLVTKDEWPRHIEIFPRKGKIRLNLTTTVRFLKTFSGKTIREVIDDLRAAIDAARKEQVDNPPPIA